MPKFGQTAHRWGQTVTSLGAGAEEVNSNMMIQAVTSVRPDNGAFLTCLIFGVLRPGRPCLRVLPVREDRKFKVDLCLFSVYGLVSLHCS